MLLVLRPITIPNKQEIFSPDVKQSIKFPIRVRAMVFNATFDYIFIISWWSVLLVEETGVQCTWKKNTDLPQVNDNIDHIYVTLY
jgi:hypothetical protein